MARRRASHRDGRVSGNSCFMDVLDRRSGELIGTTGLRVIESRHAEFDIVVHSSWQRQGVCAECFVACAVYAWHALGCHTLTASTLASNARMLAFCAKAGLRLKEERKVDSQGEWLVHQASVEDLSWAALSR